MNQQPRIAVIGAGPGGLLCARVLQLAGVDVTVYDADDSLSARTQGGTLDLHADSGQIAIEDAELLDEFIALARPEGQSKRMAAPDGTVLMEHVAAPDEFAAPEIDRAQLRTLLADSLRPGTIRWGHKLTEIRGGSRGLRFADAEGASADVVIGADGAWSRVRAALTDTLPRYTGVSFVEVLFSAVSTAHPDVARLVGDGHLWVNGDGRSMILQRNSDDVVRGYLGMRVELDWLAAAGLGAADGRGGLVADSPSLDANATQQTDTERVRAEIRSRFADFSPELLRIVDQSEGTLPNRPIMALPTPMTWDHVPGVTLLGDAAHVMSPFGGNGVNLAMLDGAELARAIIRALRDGTDLDEAIRTYEATMIPRGASIGAGANAAIVEHFAAGGPDLDGVPDFDVEAERWRAGADEYRAARLD
ncbi:MULTISPECIES: FAD-dependent oxidoreductase [unclassified Curtobacterium]|uniref:FAD-dependent oxidoreductase n=1 Tax=unclassified Curtobacterium TaxID=257496 RepID=UPI0038045E92